MKKYFDLSHIITNEMPVYPRDYKTLLMQTEYLQIHHYNSFRLESGLHSGTHIDSPMHFTNSSKFIKDYPLENFAGKACLINAKGQKIINYDCKFEALVKKDDIVLIYTGFDDFYGSEKYYDEHPVISDELCDFLIQKEIKILGVDMPSPDQMPYNVHSALLNNNIFIIENLCNLSSILSYQNIEIMAFPLKIKADASLLRVVAIVECNL